jgi:hypothetical protein
VHDLEEERNTPDVDEESENPLTKHLRLGSSNIAAFRELRLRQDISIEKFYCLSFNRLLQGQKYDHGAYENRILARIALCALRALQLQSLHLADDSCDVKQCPASTENNAWVEEYALSTDQGLS